MKRSGLVTCSKLGITNRAPGTAPPKVTSYSWTAVPPATPPHPLAASPKIVKAPDRSAVPLGRAYSRLPFLFAPNSSFRPQLGCNFLKKFWFAQMGRIPLNLGFHCSISFCSTCHGCNLTFVCVILSLKWNFTKEHKFPTSGEWVLCVPVVSTR